MKTLVLGSEGFIGKPFVNYLKNEGKDVVGVDIKHGKAEDLRFVKLDLCDVESVYFLAWDVGGAKYLYARGTQIYQIEWNMKLLSNVMPQLEKANVPFLFVSSQLATKPDTAYGATKRLGEVFTNLIGGLCVRLWNVYGVIEKPSQRSHVISDLVYSAVHENKISLLTTGEEKRDFVHIEDVCRALRVVMDMRIEGIHDISSYNNISIMDVAKIIAQETGAEIVRGEKSGKTFFADDTFDPIPEYYWHPRVTLESGLRRMVCKAKYG